MRHLDKARTGKALLWSSCVFMAALVLLLAGSR